jgi:periplasmic protein TonB
VSSLQSPLDVERVRSLSPLVACALGAAVLHGMLLTAALVVPAGVPKQRMPEKPALVNELIQVEQEPPPSPPPEAEPTPQPPAAVAPPPPKAAAVKRVKAPAAAAPAAAAAAKVLDRAPTDEVLDFGDTFVQGQAAQYAGGTTESGGTSRAKVSDPNARAYGTAQGKGDAALDRSSEPQLADRHWDCPFPDQADDEGMDSAVVGLKVRVAADGSVEQVDISQDPGHGFGRQARRCALRKRWEAGRDRAGNPIAATRLLNVSFGR